MKTPESVLNDTLPWGTSGHGLIEALDAAGFVIVPKAPTLQMLNAASEALVPSGDALACWHAMTAQNDESRHPEG